MMICFLLFFTGCSTSGEKTVKTEGLKETKVLVDEFYEGLADSDPVRMTTTMSGTVSTIFTRDGEKMYIQDLLNNANYYLFKENGKTYYMAEGGDATKEDVMYDFSLESIRMALSLFVTGVFEIEDEAGLTYAGIRTDRDDSSVLETTVRSEEENAEVKTTGTKENGKVRNITVQMTSGDNVTEIVYDFEYDVKIDLPEHTIKDMSQYYHHVDSPYATVGDFLATLEDENDFHYMVYGDEVLTLAEVDGRHYQLVAKLTEEEYASLEALDFSDEDYDKKAMEIVRGLSFTDGVDFTDAIMSQDELDTYVGKKATALLEDGFESSGYGVWEDGASLSFTKDDMEYEAQIALPEGLDTESDFEFEDLAEGEVLSIRFTDASFSAMPME